MPGHRLSPIVNFYAGSTLDRRANERDDPAAIAAYRAHPAARYLPMWRGRHLMLQPTPGTLVVGLPARGQIGLADAALDSMPWAFLGTDTDGPIFAVDLGVVEEPSALLDMGGAGGSGWSFQELRPLAPLLTGSDAALLAQARGMQHWRATHRYCGVCGQPTEAEQAGHRLACPNGHHHFPRTDPVVIMLVCHGDQALLARGTRFPPNSRVMSALAGFVEPGESAEEAVAREVFEEVGIRVRDVRYHSSQPWPFPGQLMLGFHAEALDTTLTLDPGEIAEARWVTRAQLLDHDAHGFEMPGPSAIARQLVQAWMSDLPPGS